MNLLKKLGLKQGEDLVLSEEEALNISRELKIHPTYFAYAVLRQPGMDERHFLLDRNLAYRRESFAEGVIETGRMVVECVRAGVSYLREKYKVRKE